MTGDYSFYICAAYAVCFLALFLATLFTWLSWRKVKKELGE